MEIKTKCKQENMKIQTDTEGNMRKTRERCSLTYRREMDQGWPKCIKPGSLWSITKLQSNSLCWNLCETTFTSHLEDDLNNKVMRSNKNEISRISLFWRTAGPWETEAWQWKEMFKFKLKWTWCGKSKLNKHLVNEKIILVLYIYSWFCLEHLRMRYWDY